MQGSACERINRNRGGATYVVPLCDLQRELVAWLGFQEVWDIQVGSRPFSFRQLSVTIHFGYAGDPLKPQIFRLEWPGIRDWTGAGPAFQTSGAGHPHWQIDILESLANDGAGVGFDLERPELVEDFGAEPILPEIVDAVRSMTLESMHLASAAHWWLPTNDGQVHRHMNAPSDLAGLTRWLFESLLYIQQELGRCRVRA